MNSSELFKFACQSLLVNEFPELKDNVQEIFVSGKVDIDRLIFLCSNHFVIPALYLRFQKVGLLDVFPIEYSQHLKEIYNLNKKRNREILNQIVEISTQLAKAYIEPVYLKGTANLMDNVYSDIGERMIGDIDLLVKEKDYLKAAELVKDLGYKHQEKVYYDINAAKHFPRLFKPDVPADVEIHRVPVTISHSKLFTSNLIFNNKKEIKEYSNCFVPSDEHKLIHNFIHTQLSNKGNRFKILPLRDLLDFHLLSKRVTLSDVLELIEEKNRARIYFEYAGYLFSPNQNSFTSKNRAGKRFAKCHIWFLNHPKQHRWYINILKFNYYIFNVVLGTIIKSLFQKSVRKNTIAHLKDSEWHKTVLDRLKRFFS